MTLQCCAQRGCGAPAAFRYTWPGDDEDFVCEEHAPKLRAVADACGFHLQLVPVVAVVVLPGERS